MRTLTWGFLAAIILLGCDSKSHEFPFRDQRGRECVRTCDGDVCDFQCDAVPAPTNGCGALEACFTMAYFAGSPATLGLCDSCCSETGSAFSPEDCAPIVCEADPDCAVGDAHCVDGVCVRQP